MTQTTLLERIAALGADAEVPQLLVRHAVRERRAAGPRSDGPGAGLAAGLSGPMVLAAE